MTFLIVIGALLWLGGFFFGRSMGTKRTTVQWMTHLCKLPQDKLVEVLKVLPTPFALEARKMWKDVTGE